MVKKVRQSNIELLRIIAMFLIIMFHYVWECPYVFPTFSLNKFIVKIICFFGEFGVNIFMLITGYYMSEKKISLKKIILMILEVEFYHVIITLLCIKLKIIAPVGKKDFVLLFTPIIIGKYWFVSVYLVIYALSPYINIMLNKLTKIQFQKLILLLLTLWSIIPTIWGVFYNTSEMFLYYSRFIWLFIVYIIGAYLKKYTLKVLDNKRKCFLISMITFILMIISIIVIHKFSIFARLGLTDVAYFWHPNTILMVILSVSFFSLFTKINLKSNKIINKLASTTLAIYILHNGKLSSYMWNFVFKTYNHIATNHFLIHIIYTSLIIFIVGAIIDLIRQLIEKYTVKKLLDSKMFEKIVNKCSMILTKLSAYF